MIRIVHIVRDILDNPKQVVNKRIIHHQDVVSSQSLHPRHLVHELQQESLQPWVVLRALSPAIDQLQQPWKACLINHSREQRLLAMTVEEQQTRYCRQRPRIVLLQEAVYNLCADIRRVRLKEIGREEHLRG